MASQANIKYPIGIQSFEFLREDGYTYIDKTAIIYRLINSAKYNFLSRPRRFGKSLLLSTLKAYFEGKKHLFEGLAIYDLEEKWESHPVIMLSLAAYNPNNSNLEELLAVQMSEHEGKYGILNQIADLGSRFRNLIYSAHQATGRRVAILIDEYDAPLTSHLHDEKRRQEIAGLLKSVYVNLKDMDEHIQFAMVTGVTRFSKMSIFSGLNNLKDISLDVAYSEICGLTEPEIERYLKPGIEKLAKAMEVDYTGALRLLKNKYDGYHFTEDCPDMYNPFSLLNCLDQTKFGSYWFQNGTPSFLMKALTHSPNGLPALLADQVSAAVLSDIDTFKTSVVSLLFQAGYLTIKDYDKRRMRYTLKVPNEEVEEGLFTQLLAYISETSNADVEDCKWDIRDAFEDGNPAKGLEVAKTFFAGIPPYLSQNKPEIYFENNLYLLFRLVGMEVNAEWWSADGRIDMLLRTDDYIYVMEFKLDKSAEEAMEQIDSKDYTRQFQTDGRKIVKIGVNFSSENRNIDKYIIEE